MIPSRLTALVFATLLSPAAFAASTTAAGTGPTDPVTQPRAPAINSAPGMNTDGSGVPLINQPPATGTDPRTQGSDPGRQGGMNTPDAPAAPDNAGPGVGSKTTTGGSGSEGAGQ
ncbi:MULTISPECIES: hypothetical protein [Pseudomonas]|uniref:hypothetical protein n=1 Tax=Pseudomonas TaxID=286 RepID=UPI000A1ED776|nr:MULTISPECIES: hypothetical protein [Pseudomonas]MCX4219598.1 hypothetical protein [Pseudomonas sp. MCal1]UIN54997.1 hypothetical protein LXN51_01230 [Pseudomonas kribbensis]